jgi:hypothetical protein
MELTRSRTRFSVLAAVFLRREVILSAAMVF